VPDLPWTARAEMEPGTGYLVMASHPPASEQNFTPAGFVATRGTERIGRINRARGSSAGGCEVIGTLL
jgi:hypothetical protein